jgi:hypothetical protein
MKLRSASKIALSSICANKVVCCGSSQSEFCDDQGTAKEIKRKIQAYKYM